MPVRDAGRGFLLVVEGIDGTGKSTLASGLHARLLGLGLPSVLTFEPTDGPWGRQLRRSFSAERRLSPREELDLFIRDRMEHVRTILRPALLQGRIVVCDRYYFSTMAYQGARGLDPWEIQRINEGFAPVPDLVLLLELVPEQALRRIRERRGDVPNSFERGEYLRLVTDIFARIDAPYLTRLDAALSAAELLDVSWKVLRGRLDLRTAAVQGA